MCCATINSPFISTLELRPLNLSMYSTDFEGSFFLKVAARINFGAPSEDVVRYGTPPQYYNLNELERHEGYPIILVNETFWHL